MEPVARLRESMSRTLPNRDRGTLRVLSEYDLTDCGCAGQLGVRLLLVRRMPGRLGPAQLPTSRARDRAMWRPGVGGP